MATEEAEAFATWAVATLCRALSLENVLAMFVGSLLEKQMVVICPNLVCYHSLSGICVFIVYKSICASRTAHNGGTIAIEIGPLVI
jgi:hypothetical protein